MRVKFPYSSCLLVALLVNSFVDSKNIDLPKSDSGLRQHDPLSKLTGTPIDKADGDSDKLGNQVKGQSGQQSDNNGQPSAANQYGAGAGTNAYGTYNLNNAGAAYGSNAPMYAGNPYGAPLAPNNYPYSGAYGLNTCGCSQGNNQFAHGVNGYNQNQAGSKLLRNQDAIARQGYQYNQGYFGMPAYAQYPPYNVQYPLSPAYPAPAFGYVYPQNNLYPYSYYGPQQHYYHHHLQKKRKQDIGRQDKKHRVKKQKDEKSRHKKYYRDERRGEKKHY